MKWNSSILHLLCSSNFSTTETSGALNLDTFDAALESSGDSILHSSAVSTTAFKLLGNVLSNELSITFSLLDLSDLDLNLLICELLHLLSDLLYVCTLCTNDDTWASCSDDHCNALWLTSDLNFADFSTCDLRTSKQCLSEYKILMESICILSWINIPL